MGAFAVFKGIMRDIVEKVCKIEAELQRRRTEDHLAAYNTGEKKHEKQETFS